MNLNPVSQTALWTAAIRARESARPDGLFQDPWASLLAGDEGFALLDSEPERWRDNPAVVIRTRFFDDWLQTVTNEGIHQVVLLAAGMDTRAFRLPWPSGTTLWELDRPEVFAYKESHLAASDAVPRCERRIVGVDITDARWTERLQDTGFCPQQPTCWIAEGLLVYLREEQVHHILSSLTSVSAPGSRLGVDVISYDFLTSPWTEGYLRFLTERGSPWIFGTNEPEALVSRFGWEIERILEPGEVESGKHRWPFPVVPRTVSGIPRSFLVTARRSV
jgi:methyltransferase (TIGR00027 family)